ncbi:MAG: hypothetical protein ACI9SP_003027 [Arenicella sp.]|jgi:hypothetical protein
MNTSLRLIFIFLVSVFVSTQAWGSLSTKVLEYHYDADVHFQNHQYAESKGEKLDYDALINLLEYRDSLSHRIDRSGHPLLERSFLINMALN